MSFTILSPRQLGAGTPDSSTYLRGDGTWSTPSAAASSLASGPGLTISAPGSFILGSRTGVPAEVNLTMEGSLDWAQYGYASGTSFCHKSTGGGLIGDPTGFGGAVFHWYGGNATGFTWTDGSPLASDTNCKNGIYTESIVGQGYQILVAADTVPRTLKLYCGGWSSIGKLTVALSDGSAVSYVDVSGNAGTNYYYEYTLIFQAGTSGVNLIVQWEIESTGDGNTNLIAATLVENQAVISVDETYPNSWLTLQTFTNGLEVYNRINFGFGPHTLPVNGDLAYDGTYLTFQDDVSSYAKTLNKERISITLCAGLTPSETGASTIEIPLPYHGDGVTSVTWNVRRIDLRVSTAGGAPSINVEASTGSGAFSAIAVGSLTLADGGYEGSQTSFSVLSLASGNKLRFNVADLGSASGWTIVVEFEEA